MKWKWLLCTVTISVMAAFIWWRFLPEPPFPDWLVIAIYPLVDFALPDNAHGGEELLSFLAIWAYVLVASLALWLCFGVARRGSARAEI